MESHIHLQEVMLVFAIHSNATVTLNINVTDFINCSKSLSPIYYTVVDAAVTYERE